MFFHAVDFSPAWLSGHEELLLSACNSGGALMKSLLAGCLCLCLAETLSEWEMWQ